jgi:hypothetical protein
MRTIPIYVHRWFIVLEAPHGMGDEIGRCATPPVATFTFERDAV